jgi:diketogulonate reductase-like aldo/keto reductase
MIRLSDGNDMPAVGLASFRKNTVDETKQQISNSLGVGMKYFEITELFGNEHMIMEALQNTPRSDIFISLRLWPKDRKYKDVLRAVKATLQGANLGYVDLLVLHAPIDPVNKFDQWKAMEELKDMGLVRSLGAGSLTLLQLMDLLKNCNFAPSILEVRLLLNFQFDLLSLMTVMFILCYRLK